MRDNGVGVPPELHHLLLRPFSQILSEDGAKSEGTGVGLASVKLLVDRMGGSITFSSAVGTEQLALAAPVCGCFSMLEPPPLRRLSANRFLYRRPVCFLRRRWDDIHHRVASHPDSDWEHSRDFVVWDAATRRCFVD